MTAVTPLKLSQLKQAAGYLRGGKLETAAEELVIIWMSGNTNPVKTAAECNVVRCVAAGVSFSSPFSRDLVDACCLGSMFLSSNSFSRCMEPPGLPR